MSSCAPPLAGELKHDAPAPCAGLHRPHRYRPAVFRKVRAAAVDVGAHFLRVELDDFGQVGDRASCLPGKWRAARVPYPSTHRGSMRIDCDASWIAAAYSPLVRWQVPRTA